MGILCKSHSLTLDLLKHDQNQLIIIIKLNKNYRTIIIGTVDSYSSELLAFEVYRIPII